MKQKLFENVGGNQFKLITESVEEPNPKAKLVREGLKKVFGNGIKELSYKYLQGIGLGYIKQVEEAKKTALQEARTLAKEYGYMDQEASQKFVKENDFSKLDAQDPMSAMAKISPAEIGQQIIAIVDSPGMDQAMETEKGKLRQLAQNLIQQ